MIGELIRRKKTSGIAVLLVASVPALVWWNERHSQASPSDSEAFGVVHRHVPSDETPGRADTGQPGGQLRKTLGENLPQGAEILKRNGPGIAVSLPHGVAIEAAGAAVTENGVSFKGPYQVTLQNGSSLSSEEEDYNFYVSQDGTRVHAKGSYMVVLRDGTRMGTRNEEPAPE